MVDDVGTPVEKLTAAEFGDGLPVVPALITVSGQLDFINMAQLTGVDDIHGSFKTVFKPTVMPDVQMRSCRFAAQCDQLFRLCCGHTEGLFQHNILPCQQCHFGMGIMIHGTGGDGYQFHFGICQKIFDPCIGTAAEFFCKGYGSFFNTVAHSRKMEFVTSRPQFVAVHTVTGSAQTNQTHLNGFRHKENLLEDIFISVIIMPVSSGKVK